jgi:cytochrome c553
MARKSNKNNSPRVIGVVLAALGALTIGALGTSVGCVPEQPDGLGPLPSGSTTGGDPKDSGTSVNKGEELFKAMEPEFMQSCGLCHDIGGIADTPFLAQKPTRYQSMVSWPGIVRRNPEESLLLTYSMIGKGHSGSLNLDSPQLVNTLLPKVKEWLAAEAETFVGPAPDAADADLGPALEPFVPILGFNAIYLGPLGPDFEGMAITFSAELLAAGTLELTNIQVHPTSKKGVHIVHPLFTVYPKGGEPDPDVTDSFSNVDQTFLPGESGELGPGTFVLVNWKDDARLGLVFETIEAHVPPNPDAGMPTGGCKAVDVFMANAQTRFQVCTNCHAGANGQATAAIDMSQLNTDPAAACAQIKNRVTPADPPNSQIFITTDPGGNAAHPYKFGGNAQNFTTFRNDVSVWIAAEQ